MHYINILAPVDGSDGSWKAFGRALILAREQSAQITVLSVEEHLPHYAATVGEVEGEREQENEYSARVQSQAVALAKEQGVPVQTEVVAGHAAQAIVQYAHDRGCDLIVIGHRGHSGIWGTLLGSTTHRVVDQAGCDVLVVR